MGENKHEGGPRSSSDPSADRGTTQRGRKSHGRVSGGGRGALPFEEIERAGSNSEAHNQEGRHARFPEDCKGCGKGGNAEARSRRTCRSMMLFLGNSQLNSAGPPNLPKFHRRTRLHRRIRLSSRAKAATFASVEELGFSSTETGP